MPSSVTTTRPGWRARIAARTRPGSLDRALIGGADIARSPQLQARALQLTSPSARLALADGLERLIAAAGRPGARLRVRAPRASVTAATPQLRDLAALLRGPVPVYARGLAMLTELLADGTGALYARGGAARLQRALDEARVALGGDSARSRVSGNALAV